MVYHKEETPMYLKKAKNSKTGRTYLSCAQGYRDENGKSRTRTIESFGYLDELEKQFSDPVAHFTQVVKEREAESGESFITFRKSRNKKIDKKSDNRKNLGYAALSHIYHLFGLDTFVRNKSRAFAHRFNVESAFRLLIFERALYPGSKKSAWERRHKYFDKFDFSLDDTYLTLDFLADIKEELVTHLHTEVDKRFGRNTDCVFYDVTNFHFECDRADDLRKKGVSKNHMPKPIVQMGLLMDQAGLPITYELFPGNTNDCKTLLPHLEKAKGELAIKRVVVVGDKAMNTSDNIVATLGKKDGYLFSQSIRKATDELKRYVLDDNGYRETIEIDDEGCPFVSFRVKSRIAERTISIERPDEEEEIEIAPGITVVSQTSKDGVTKRKFKLIEKQVVKWSQKYAQRAKAKREEAVAKAQRYVDNPSKLKGMLDRTAAKYVSGVTYDSDSGEIIDAKKILMIDEERIAQEELLDGYYIITSSELEWSDEKIIGAYSGLWKIEETFKVTKSYLEGRPVFVWTKKHIEAHFLICFVTLLILRILEGVVNEGKSAGKTHSLYRIIETLKAAEGSNIDGNWWLFDHRDDCLDDIGRALDIDFTKEILSKGDIRKLLGATKKVN